MKGKHVHVHCNYHAFFCPHASLGFFVAFLAVLFGLFGRCQSSVTGDGVDSMNGADVASVAYFFFVFLDMIHFDFCQHFLIGNCGVYVAENLGFLPSCSCMSCFGRIRFPGALYFGCLPSKLKLGGY